MTTLGFNEPLNKDSPVSVHLQNIRQFAIEISIEIFKVFNSLSAGFRVSFRVGGQFSLGVIVLEPLLLYGNLYFTICWYCMLIFANIK